MNTQVAVPNWHAVRAIYNFEMARTWRTLMQSIISPVISTSLYFVVFGAAIGSRIQTVGGIPYGAFIVPGLIMLSLLTQSISNASFGIYFPKFTGTIYELLSAPVSYVEIVIAYVGAAASKSIILGLIILATAALHDDGLALSADGTELTYTYDTRSEARGIVDFMKHVNDAGIAFKDLRTKQSSLEEIFVSLVEGGQQ